MMTKPKVLLGLAILFLIAGAVIATTVNTQTAPYLNVVFPLGTIFAGAFLVVLLFENESKIAVEDQKRALREGGIEAPSGEMPAKRGSVLSE